MRPHSDNTTPETPVRKKSIRQTEQRKAVFDALMARTDHPSAVEVFMRVKNRVPSISLATVYNCLETLTTTGLVRAVNHEREPSRYCANLQEHAHLFCSECGSVTDIPLHTPMPPEQIWNLPEGIRITDQEVSFRGQCAACSAARKDAPRQTAASLTASPSDGSSSTSPAPNVSRNNARSTR